jgi:hypothetical protein
MEDQDKTYLWLVVISFIAITLAMVFSIMGWLELHNQDMITSNGAEAAPAASAAAAPAAAH